MKQYPFFLLCVVALSFAACSTSSPPPSTSSTMDAGAATTTTTTSTTVAPTDSTATSNAQQTSTPTPNAQAQPKPWSPPADSTASNAATPKYPTAIAIPGKKGFVKSPYAQYAAPVDVRGFASGTIVRCPYTNKKFIVP